MIELETPSERELYARYCELCANDGVPPSDILDRAWLPIHRAMIAAFTLGQSRTERSGKGYLTFAMYDWLCSQGKDAHVTHL